MDADVAQLGIELEQMQATLVGIAARGVNGVREFEQCQGPAGRPRLRGDRAPWTATPQV